jgi:shikimate kinase
MSCNCKKQESEVLKELKELRNELYELKSNFYLFRRDLAPAIETVVERVIKRTQKSE